MLDWAIDLSEAAADALVRTAATDAWSGAKTTVVNLFGSSSKKRAKQMAIRLDNDALALTSADEDDRARIQGQVTTLWAARINDLLEEHPELADAVEIWVADQDEKSRQPQSPTQNNRAREGGTVFAVMNGSQDIHFGSDSERIYAQELRSNPKRDEPAN